SSRYSSTGTHIQTDELSHCVSSSRQTIMVVISTGHTSRWSSQNSEGATISNPSRQRNSSTCFHPPAAKGVDSEFGFQQSFRNRSLVGRIGSTFGHRHPVKIF